MISTSNSALTEEWTGAGAPVGAWSTGGNMVNARQQIAGAGTQTAAVAFGGSPGEKNETELYDGSTWTEVNNLNTARFEMGGAGVSTSALGIGGELPTGQK